MLNKKVVIVSGVRTAIGEFMGGLSTVNQIDLGAIVVKEAVKRAGIDPAVVDEVIVGNVGQVAESGFIGRAVMLKAGLPKETTAYSLNRQCASGLQTIADAALKIAAGYADVMVACGTENMSQSPYYIKGARTGMRMGHQVLEDGVIDLLTWPLGPFHNGTTAENVAEKYNISREDQDAFALLSQENTIAAIDAGKFKDEIIPVEIKDKKTTIIIDTDEHPRRGLTMEKLAKLRPAFREGGTVTAANASGINDGAGAVVLMSEEKAKELGCTPLMEVVDYAYAGNEPELMGFAPALSTKKLLKKLDITPDDLDIIELNEAFASQSLAVIRDVGFDIKKVNVNGGAIALGHPVGATGCILPVKMMYEMKRTGAKIGLVTMCVGGGQGISVIFKNMQ
jgi:acetyl-CoA C-acetyltransferase